mmetsp:Transcript_95234/g.275262  ORF Transcript_95234/g.275262 Transcript_95234/m.275262 type:complete len:240 (+) Transcript_95234:1117-1836(+)
MVPADFKTCLSLGETKLTFRFGCRSASASSGNSPSSPSFQPAGMSVLMQMGGGWVTPLCAGSEWASGLGSGTSVSKHSMGYKETSAEPKPQQASQRSHGEKERPQIQSIRFGIIRTTISFITSQMQTCMSSPPVAKKRDCDVQAKERTPAAQVSSEAFSKSRSTRRMLTLPSWPPTATNFPDGENAVAFTMVLKFTVPANLQSSSCGSRHTTAFIIAGPLGSFAIKPCPLSLPPPAPIK